MGEESQAVIASSLGGALTALREGLFESYLAAIKEQKRLLEELLKGPDRQNHSAYTQAIQLEAQKHQEDFELANRLLSALTVR